MLLGAPAPADAGPADPRPEQIAGHSLEACDNRPVYMVVAGPTRDRERMLAYGKAIADSRLYEQLGGYYVNVPAPLATFEGTPPKGMATLIVRFPCLANARAFWYSKTYQETIVPLRQNPSAGDYVVTVYPEAALPPYMTGRVGDAAYVTDPAAGGTTATSGAARVAFALPPGLVLGVDADTAPAFDIGGGWPAASVAVLRRDARTGEAYRLSFAARQRLAIAPVAVETEIYVERGEVETTTGKLGAGDYLRIAAGGDAAITGVVADTRLLLFRTPGGDGGGAVTVVRGSERPWHEGQVAKGAGLRIKHLRGDTASGPRTFLVHIAPGLGVPWEIHSTAEEGYLLDGEYRLAECLPTGRRDFSYDPGGYFYRPAGLVHSGPDSTATSVAGATWLIRTPRVLDATFYPKCPAE
jgi:uncharacterized protein (DUF1330 family)/quercetin dioxygenase-like cupin family protein